MELVSSLFLILALAVIVIIYIGRPFLLKTGQKPAGAADTPEQNREHQVSTLLAERDRVLNALQELDFDYSLGKIPPEEYPQQRAVLLKSGADVLRQLDEIAAVPAVSKNLDIEERIEEAVAARRADAVNAGAGDLGVLQTQIPVATVEANGNGKGKDALEDIIAARKRHRKEAAAGFCPRCGRPVQKSDKFCSKCGATL